MRYLFLLICIFVTACSDLDQTIYDSAISFERNKANLTVSQVAVNQHNITYLDNGNTEATDTLLFLHGFGANKDSWLRLAKEMSAQYRIVIIDLLGHGDSDKPLDGNYTIDAQASLVAKVMAELDIQQYHIAGNSMGGAIALQIEYQYPQRALSLALLNAAGVKGKDTEFNALLSSGSNPLIISNAEEFPEIIAWAMEKPPWMPSPVRRIAAQKQADQKAILDIVFASILADDNINQEDILPRTEAPALIIWGEKDRLLDVSNAQIFANYIQDSKVHILPGIGHVPMVEAPKDTASAYFEFLDSI